MEKEVFFNNLVYGDKFSDNIGSTEKNWVLNLVPAAKKILEVGCNTGIFTKMLIDKKCDVTGVEIDPFAANISKNTNTNLIVGDIEDSIVFEKIEGTFDIILLMHVLEHMIDPWNVLKKLKSKLNKDGFILVLIPSISFWGFRRKFLLTGDFTYTDTGILDKTHLRFFNYHTAKGLLTGSGYKIIEEKIPNYSIPLSVRIRKVPLLKHIEKHWNKWMIKRFPNLVGEIFLFKAIPVRNE